MIEVAIFPDRNSGFYPKEISDSVKSNSLIELRAEVLPDFINDIKEFEGTPEEASELYDGLEIGSKARVGNKLYHSELVVHKRFNIDDLKNHYPPNKKPEKSHIDSLEPMEWIVVDNKFFKKSKCSDFIYEYKQRKSIIELVKVDTSRFWTIDIDENGAEYIQYLDYNIIDDKYNYCERVKY